MKPLLALLVIPPLALIAIPLMAATTVQPVTEVSAQQAIVRYRTTLSASTACSHAITETLGGATPDDANPSIFAGSNLDARPGSIINAPDRAFVFGQRTSAPGLDGLLHSRSAKANTAYTDVVTCGADAPVTISFITGNIPTGGTYVEQPPFNPSGFGNWAWPSVNWSNQAVQSADPQTGVAIQRMTSPGWWGKETGFANFDFAIGGSGWTNPQNVLQGANCAGTSANCAQSPNSNSIFLSMKGQNYSTNNTQWSSGYSSSESYDDILLALTGKASASGAASVAVCLVFYDSQTCNSSTQTITLSTSVSTVGFPAAGIGYAGGTNQWNPVFQFGEWGGTAPKQGDFGMAYGTAGAGTGVTTSGTSVTGDCAAHSASQSCFNVKWNNAYFYIQGSGCTDGGTDICQLSGHPADTQHLTLKNAPATACSSQCNWNSLNAGFLITPNGVGTVDIGAQYSYAYSAMFGLPIAGFVQVCNPVPVSVGYQADGATPISPAVSGNLCFLQGPPTLQGGELSLLIPSTGESRLLSPLFAQQNNDSGDASGDQNAGQIEYNSAPWDGLSGLCFFGTANAQTGQLSIYKACYDTTKNWKAYSHPLYACANCASNTPNGVVPGQDATVIWYDEARWADDPVIYTNITPPSMGLGVLAQIEASNPNFKSTIWNYFGSGNFRVGNGVFTMLINAGEQGTSGSFAFFSTTTGLITAWGDTLNSFPLRFGAVHSTQISRSTPGYMGVTLNYLDFNNSSITLGGPFQSTPYYVYFSGTPSTNTALTATSPLEACSGYTISSSILALITQNGGQNQCMHIRMKNVASHAPSAAELAVWPSPQNGAWSEPTVLQAGDTIALNHEQALVAAVTTGVTDSQCSSDCLDVVVARGIPLFSNGGPPEIEPNGWVAVAGPTLAACTNGGGCQPGVGAWLPLNTAGALASTAISDAPAFGSHGDGGAGLTSGNMTFVSANYEVRFNRTVAAQAGSFAGANQIALNAPFAGKTGSIIEQSYPSNEQYSASSAQEKRWATDFNHTNPSVGIGGEQFIEIDSIAYSLVSGSGDVYKVTAPAGGLTVNEANYKTNGIQGWAGYNLMQDVSGPSSSVSSSTPYAICFALAAGECRSGSSVGDIYAVVPNVPAILSNCVTNWIVESYPCIVFSLPNTAGSLTQRDVSYSYGVGEGARVLTRGLSGYGRQFEFNTFIADSTGTHGLFKTDWADGVRSDVFMAKLPPFPGGSSIPRNTFINLPVLVPAGAAYAEIKFGYMENGGAPSSFCTSRQDVCTTSGSPFVYPSVDSRTLTSCASGCTLHIPAIAGRAVYYSIGSSANGATWTYGALQVGLVQ